MLTKNQKDFLEGTIAKIRTDKARLIVKDVLAKKELGNLSEEFVLEKIKKYLSTHKKACEKLGKENYLRLRRAKEYKALVKEIRAELREVYGVFILKDYNKLPKLLEGLKKNPSLETHNKILGLHKSTKERLPYYAVVYKKIFETTGMPRRIVDLACGLNPFSYPYISALGYKPEYIACDLAEKDLAFIDTYFKIMGIQGKTRKIDLLRDDLSAVANASSRKGEKGNVVFLLKTLDSLETIKRNVSEQILKEIKEINAEIVVVSFSTKSLGGRKTIKKERRSWFEKLIHKLKYTVKSFEIPGEMFYILISRQESRQD